MESLWDCFTFLRPNCPSPSLPYTLSTTRSSNLSSSGPNTQWYVNMVRQLLIQSALSKPNGIDVHFFCTKCVSSTSRSHSPFKKLGTLDHIMTIKTQTLQKPLLLVSLLTHQRSWLLKLPFGGCCSSKYKQEKKPFNALTKLMDISGRHANGTLQFAIVWATHKMQNAWKVWLCMDRKHARYEEIFFGKYVLCENCNVIKLWSIEHFWSSAIMEKVI
jgi:hypothetical protein